MAASPETSFVHVVDTVRTTTAATPWWDMELPAAIVGALLGGFTALAVALVMSRRESRERSYLIRAVVLDEMSTLAQLLARLISPVRRGQPIPLGLLQNIDEMRMRYEKSDHLILYLQPTEVRPLVRAWFRQLGMIRTNLDNFLPSQNPDARAVRAAMAPVTARALVALVRGALRLCESMGLVITLRAAEPHTAAPKERAKRPWPIRWRG